ncbi:MAG: hypothetical protein PHI55_13855 [Burkholderiaceae bacterium]|nr:hypothetical protein [Burkholderiaceae bacterium]
MLISMVELSELTSQACVKVGSSTKLAEMLEVPQPAISMWKNGTRPCPPEDQARIAAVLGLDPVEALVGAVMERHAGTPKGEALAMLFANCRRKNENALDSHQGRLIGGNGKLRKNSKQAGLARLVSLCQRKVLESGFVTRYTTLLITLSETPKRIDKPCMV